jgi:2'-5' RNA ligase
MKTRTFLAVNLSSQLKKKIQKEIANLKRQYNNFPIKWIQSQNIHLTLYFFGSLSEQELNLLRRLLRQEIKPVKERIFFDIKQRDCFPDRQRARILFLSLKENQDFLKEKWRVKIGQILKNQGFNFDCRPWQAHLTLGRARQSLFLNQNFTKTQLVGQKIPVDSLDLMESKLTPQGPIYTLIEKFFL